jgi:hypothetical protein
MSLAPEVVQALAALVTPTVSGLTEPSATEGEPAAEGEEKEVNVSDLTKEIIEATLLNELSTAFESLINEVKEVKERLAQVEQDDREKVEAKAKAVPQFAWFQASQAEETVTSSKDTSATPPVPDAVKAIAGRIDTGP